MAHSQLCEQTSRELEYSYHAGQICSLILVLEVQSSKFDRDSNPPVSPRDGQEEVK